MKLKRTSISLLTSHFAIHCLSTHLEYYSCCNVELIWISLQFKDAIKIAKIGFGLRRWWWCWSKDHSNDIQCVNVPLLWTSMRINLRCGKATDNQNTWCSRFWFTLCTQRSVCLARYLKYSLQHHTHAHNHYHHREQQQWTTATRLLKQKKTPKPISTTRTTPSASSSIPCTICAGERMINRTREKKSKFL